MTAPTLTAPAATGIRSRVASVRRMPAVTLLSVGFIVTVSVVALFAPLLAPHDPNAIDLLNPFAGSSPEHLLGTDNLGRDIFSRLVIGSRTALLGPLLIVIIATTVATALGVLAAWYGGSVDTVVSRGIDFVFVFPGLLLAILSAAVFGAGLTAAVVALSIAYVPYIGRVVRGAALRVRAMPFVESCEIHGFSGLQTCARHIVPNLLPTLVTQVTVCFGYAMVDLAAISYLGLGVQPPHPDWGQMVSSGQQDIVTGHPQQSLYAGIAIILVVLSVTTLGDALQRSREGVRT